MKVVFTGQARTELNDIAVYIARDNKKRALSFVAELRRAAQNLRDAPRGFPLVPRYEAHGIRRRPYQNYLIFYMVGDESISIIHVLHAAQDYETLLFPVP